MDVLGDFLCRLAVRTSSFPQVVTVGTKKLMFCLVYTDIPTFTSRLASLALLSPGPGHTPPVLARYTLWCTLAKEYVASEVYRGVHFYVCLWS